MIGLTQDSQVKSEVLWTNQVVTKGELGLWMYAKIDGFLGLGSNLASHGFIDQLYQQNYIQVRIFKKQQF